MTLIWCRNDLDAGNGVDDHPQLRHGSCQEETVRTVAFYRVNCQPDLYSTVMVTVMFLWFRFPTLFHNDKESEEWPAWTPEKLQALAPPRIIKTHLPFYLLPPRLTDTSKVLHINSTDQDNWISLIRFELIDTNRWCTSFAIPRTSSCLISIITDSLTCMPIKVTSRNLPITSWMTKVYWL